MRWTVLLVLMPRKVTEAGEHDKPSGTVRGLLGRGDLHSLMSTWQMSFQAVEVSEI